MSVRASSLQSKTVRYGFLLTFNCNYGSMLIVHRAEGRTRMTTGRKFAAGALAACSAVGVKVTPLAAAQAKPDITATDLQLARATRFDIPPGALEDVLPAFQQVTGWRVAVQEQGLLRLQSPGVSGVHSAQAAMERLLDGTGLTYRLKGVRQADTWWSPVLPRRSPDTLNLIPALS